jgi:hypothetical protein
MVSQIVNPTFKRDNWSSDNNNGHNHDDVLVRQKQPGFNKDLFNGAGRES